MAWTGVIWRSPTIHWNSTSSCSISFAIPAVCVHAGLWRSACAEKSSEEEHDSERAGVRIRLRDGLKDDPFARSLCGRVALGSVVARGDCARHREPEAKDRAGDLRIPGQTRGPGLPHTKQLTSCGVVEISLRGENVSSMEHVDTTNMMGLPPCSS